MPFSKTINVQSFLRSGVAGMDKELSDSRLKRFLAKSFVAKREKDDTDDDRRAEINWLDFAQSRPNANTLNAYDWYPRSEAEATVKQDARIWENITTNVGSP